jgi:hypothetical protein
MQVYEKHKFDPLHEVPSGAFGLEHMPEFGSHVPATWQPSEALHPTESVPVHAPPAQA